MKPSSKRKSRLVGSLLYPCLALILGLWTKGEIDFMTLLTMANIFWIIVRELVTTDDKTKEIESDQS